MLGVNEKMISMGLGVILIGVLTYVLYLQVQYKFVTDELKETVRINKELNKKVMAGKVNELTLKTQIDKQNAIYSKLSIEYDKKIREFEKWKQTDRDKYIKEDLPELEGESDECKDIIDAINVINTRGL